MAAAGALVLPAVELPDQRAGDEAAVVVELPAPAWAEWGLAWVWPCRAAGVPTGLQPTSPVQVWQTKRDPDGMLPAGSGAVQSWRCLRSRLATGVWRGPSSTVACSPACKVPTRCTARYQPL